MMPFEKQCYRTRPRCQTCGNEHKTYMHVRFQMMTYMCSLRMGVHDLQGSVDGSERTKAEAEH